MSVLSTNRCRDWLMQFFQDAGVNAFWSDFFALSILLISVLIGGYVILLISRKGLIYFFHKISAKTSSHFDDFLISNKVPLALSYLSSLFFLAYFLPQCFNDGSAAVLYLKNVVEVALVVIIVLVVSRTFLALRDYLRTLVLFKDKPIDSYIQVALIFLWFTGGVLILSILTGKSITVFLTTMGALSAVLILVFKDTILGFVASIQVAVNDTVRIGDWITMKESNADGTVTKINLSAIHIQNFDNTITLIPTHKLIFQSFVNWRGMSMSGGRRIKRSILIKVSSIRFLTEEEIESLSKIERIAAYIKKRKDEIVKYNETHSVNKSLLINGRNMTNIGLFRHYAETYLENHPMINQKMTVMCRQLSPSSQGVPIEIYAFSRDKVWKNYEHITADVFDHLLSSVKYFHLECFELTALTPQELSS